MADGGRHGVQGGAAADLPHDGDDAAVGRHGGRDRQLDPLGSGHHSAVAGLALAPRWQRLRRLVAATALHAAVARLGGRAQVHDGGAAAPRRRCAVRGLAVAGHGGGRRRRVGGRGAGGHARSARRWPALALVGAHLPSHAGRGIRPRSAPYRPGRLQHAPHRRPHWREAADPWPRQRAPRDRWAARGSDAADGRGHDGQGRCRWLPEGHRADLAGARVRRAAVSQLLPAGGYRP
mmetsp:Transcript_4064/g.11772  ORF Transcript_4064/g.11772 Transcript_4064/m.11772 type:complete len:235 (+) Transcript_4064:991-1695(+)